MNNSIEILLWSDINKHDTSEEKVNFIEHLITELDGIIDDIHNRPWDFE